MAESTRPSIEWVDAERERLDEIQHFTCTSPIPRGPGGRRLEHPKRYELTAQSVIRNCKPPVHEPHVLLLGLIEGEIATVASFTYLLNSSQQAPIVFINAIGLSTTFRGGDGSMADETLQRVLIRTGSDLGAKGYTEAMAQGNIHRLNLRSQALVARTNFQADGPAGDEYQQWTCAFNW